MCVCDFVYMCILFIINWYTFIGRWECALGLYKIHGIALKAMCWPSALWPEINMVVIRRNISYNISHEIWMWVSCALFSLGLHYICWWFLIICSPIFVNIQSVYIEIECWVIVLSAQVICWWLSTRLQYLQCISNGVTAVLLQAIDVRSYAFMH